MTWATPWWFAALPVVAVVAVLLLVTARRHLERLRTLFAGSAVDEVLPPAVRSRRRVRDVLFVAGLVFGVVALAGPRYGKTVRTMQERGVDLVLAVDLSRSMDARDVEPSRLERARREIRDLVGLLESDRVGLVVFAGGAYPRMPLTRDTDALMLLVDELGTDQFQAQGSAMGEALRVGMEMFGDGTRGRAILLLTDGEVHQVGATLDLADRAHDQGVRIYGLVIGERPSPIPLRSGTHALDDNGQVVITRPSTDLVRDLARRTGGAWAKSVASDEDVRSLYFDEIRQSLRANESARVEREVWRSAHPWPLALSVLLLIGSAWMGDGAVMRVVLAMLLVSASTTAQAGPLADADAHFRQGAYAEAVRELTELAVRSPADGDLWDRLGAARYRAGDFEGAARAWDRAVEHGGGLDSTYNAGNAHYLAGRLEEALARYEDVLGDIPGHESAAHNRKLLLEELERRRRNRDQRPPAEGERRDDPASAGASGAAQEEGRSPGEEPPGEADSRAGSVESGQTGEGGTPTAEKSEAESTQQEAVSSDGRSGGRSDQELQEDVISEVVDPSTVVEDGGGTAGEVAPLPPAGDRMDPAQARRVLEGVEEGRPRVVLPGEVGDHPW